MRGHAELALEFEGVRRIRPELLEIRRAAELGETLVQQLCRSAVPTRTEHHIVDVGESLTPMLGILQRLVGKAVDIELNLTDADNVRAHGARSARAGGDESRRQRQRRDAAMAGGCASRRRSSIARRATCCAGKTPFLELTVSDTGAGIPAEIRQQIFDPFFTTKALGRGTGLGLAIVTAIVQDAGGEIAVESEMGRGTSFRIYLPLWDSQIDDSIRGD